MHLCLVVFYAFLRLPPPACHFFALNPAPFAGTVLDKLLVAWRPVAERAKARCTGFLRHQQNKPTTTTGRYVHERPDDTISKHSPLACRERLSRRSRITAQRRSWARMISWILK